MVAVEIKKGGYMSVEYMDKVFITRDAIREYIIAPLPPEEHVALILYRKGITEEEFLNMQNSLNVNQPTIIRIANHLRDKWRKYNK